MKYYKYVTKEDDIYDEEILFYCHDKNKDYKIKNYLSNTIKEINLYNEKQFYKHKETHSGKVFKNKDTTIVVYYRNNQYLKVDLNKLPKSDCWYLNDIEYSYIPLTDNRKYVDVTLPFITEKEFKELKLKEVNYILKNNFVIPDIEISFERYIGNYSNFKPKKLTIKDIENQYELIEINFD